MILFTRIQLGFVMLVVGASTAHAQFGPPWAGYGGGATHQANSRYAAVPLEKILWSAPVDLQPQYNGTDLLWHYASPMVTGNNNVVFAVKTGAGDGWRFESRGGTDGSLNWSFDTDYSVPSHGWGPTCGGVISGFRRLVMPGAGGTVWVKPEVDNPSSAVTRLCFYGDRIYADNSADLNAKVKICTPITGDEKGNIWFGFRVSDPNNAGRLKSGIARIGADGVGNWVAASAAADSTVTTPTMNCAPALSADGKCIYISVNSEGFTGGYLLQLDATSLATLAKVRLKDPKTGNDGYLPDDGTATPLIGPDGDVYYGILENGFGSNHLRGWLLHFDNSLSISKTPGAFGWDHTPSIVPSRCVPSYTGGSTYLLVTKYNNYVSGGGDGVNKVAVLDPNVAATESVSGISTMREVLLRAGPTPDPEFVSAHPNAVREWCINTAAVDPATSCAIVNCEDGRCYRWDFRTNTLSQGLTLASGIGEAYTPTVIGPRACYAISNARLYAMGPATPRRGGGSTIRPRN